MDMCVFYSHTESGVRQFIAALSFGAHTHIRTA